MRTACLLSLLCLITGLKGQTAPEEFPLLTGELWRGGQISQAHKMPFPSGYSTDLSDNAGSQVQPLLLSNLGRYLYSTKPFQFTFTDTSIQVIPARNGTLDFGRLGRDVKDVYGFVAENYFQFSARPPAEILFTNPQYNTRIELGYNQNQADIMKYAKGLIDAGFPTGVLMIDDNWQRDYGDWQFRHDRFPDPKGMVDSLHEMGFQVMLWICPFVSPDGAVFRQLFEPKDAFLKDPNYPDRPKLVQWWNGYSALLDLTNPDAEAWLRQSLTSLQEEYGIDGFQFDGGDLAHYDFVISAQKNTSAARHSQLYGQLGFDYPLNEYRATFGLGGQALAQRLSHKPFSWEALKQFIPGMTLMGIMGYPFACPDMIGGGEHRSFSSLTAIDQELIVRSAQIHALMPMMQFSLAPWRVLDEEHLGACRKAALLHTEFAAKILALSRESALSGAPIVRSMAYTFPNYGYDRIDDQFMLGEAILVAPVMVKGARTRTVQLPPGRWRYLPTGKAYTGNQVVEVAAPLDVLPYFEQMK